MHLKRGQTASARGRDSVEVCRRSRLLQSEDPAADGRASSKASKASGQEKIFNLRLMRLQKCGNDFLKTL